MSQNSYDPDDPTQRLNPQQPQPEQGKLVLGGFNDPQSPNQPPRKPPYQYQPPASPPQQRPPHKAGPSQPVSPPQQGPAHRPAQAEYQQRNAGNFPPQTPYGPGPNQQRPPYQQGAFPPAGANRPPTDRRRPRNRRNGCMIGCLSVLVLLILLGTFVVTTTQKVLAFGSAISPKSPLSSATGYMNTSDRTNILVMGFGGGTHDGAFLTDSMLIISVLPQSHHTSLISVPRDLWVQYPPNSGNYGKINSIYTLASQNNSNNLAGGAAAAQKVSLITGMNVPYWLTIDFTGFKKVIDSIGGIDVYVPDAFNACYPKNDDASVDASWVKADFKKGTQHMDGATAIEYARAREPLEVCGMGTSENPAELTDFGRSARQQIIIKAVLSKVKQISTWPRLYAAMDALQQSIRTNMSLADLGSFALKMDLNDPHAAHIGLSNQNVLEDTQSSDGQDILLPTNGQWSIIPPYIQGQLYK
jgi:polyisoprenyl-teichoic acid--peptidoglycan teichoic acid transferase